MKRLVSLFIISLFISITFTVTFSAQSASAAGNTCTWDATPTNSTFTNPANWTTCATSGGVPEEGDALVFPATASTIPVNYDDNGERYTTITINGDYEFTGNTIEVSGGITTAENIGVSFEQVIDITSTDDFTITIGTTSDPIVFGGFDLDLANDTFSIVESTEGGAIVYMGGFVGTADSIYISDVSFLWGGTNTVVATNGIEFDATAGYCTSASCFGNSNNLISVNNGGQINYDIAGTFTHDLILENSMLISRSANVVYSGDIEVTSMGVFSTISNGNLVIQGDINLTDSTASFSSANYDTEYINVTGDITGTGSVWSSGDFISSGTNTFDGTLTVADGGSAHLVNLESFSANADYIVDNGGTLRTDANGTLDIDLSIAGTGLDLPQFDGAFDYSGISGGLTLEGTIALTDNARIAATSQNTLRTLTINSAISGDYDLELNVPSLSGDAILLGGTNPNTYNDLYAIGGNVYLQKENAAPNDVYVNVTAGNNDVAQIVVDSPSGNAIGGALDLAESTFDDAGGYTFAIFSGEQEIKGLTGLGFVGLRADSQLTLNITGTNTFDGIFSDDSTDPGERRVIKTGSGEFISTNTFPDNWSLSYPVRFDVVEGIATFTNTLNNELNVFAAGGTVRGTGVLGSLTQDAGIVAPGMSPGCLTSAGDVDFGAVNSSLDIELGGTTACTGYDQVVSGTDINLNLTTLRVGLYNNFVPVEGNVFTIVRAPNITSTFAGVTNGSLYHNNGITYRVAYNTGVDGEDSVTLTVVNVTEGSLSNTGSEALDTTGLALSLLLVGCAMTLMISKRRKIHV